MNSNRHVITVAVFALLVSGCVTQPTGPDPLQPGVAAISVETAHVKNADLDVDGNGASVGKNLVVGTLGGAVAGAAGGAYMSLACGPFVLFCAPVFAIAGAGAGVIVGSVAGTVNGVITGLPAEKAKQFNATVTETIDEALLHQQLHQRFVTAANPHWTIDSGAINRVDLQIKALRFEQMKDDHLKLVMCASTRVKSPRRTRTWYFKFDSTAQHIDTWLSDDGALMQQAVDAGMEHLAGDMVEALYRLGTTGSAPNVWSCR